MLRPRKALAAASRQLPKQHSRPSTASARPPPPRQPSPQQRLQATQSDHRDAEHLDANAQQQPRHPVDALYSTLISRIGPRTAAASPIAHAAGSSSTHAASSARRDAHAHAFTHASPWALKQLLPPSADADRHRQIDPKGDALLALAPPSPSKAETPAQQLRRREQRFSFIVEAVQMQLSNCSGRLHLPDRYISDFEFLYIVRCLPVGTGLCTALVTRLMLDGNRITSVDDVPWPPSLTHISLRHNMLTCVSNARWPPHLRCLHLDSNAIQRAAPPPPAEFCTAASQPRGTVTPWPLHLTVLDLGRNKLTGVACVSGSSDARRAVTLVFL